MRLATICARAGSKRLPGKNTRLLNDMPLWLHTIAQAGDAGCFDLLVISSDDPAIKSGSMWMVSGVHWLRIKRPAELATDEAGKVPVIRHALSETERLTGKTFDQIVDLDVTAPLRVLDDIRGFCAKLDTIQHGGLVSVCKSRRSPAFNMVELRENGTARLLSSEWTQTYLRSQDVPQTYDLNASMTGWTRDYLMEDGDHPVKWNTYIYEMPRERSWDIDDAHDLEIVAFLMNRQKEAKAA